jgi:hypothetical protein
MARLPSELWLIQQIGDEVILFEEGTEREIVRIPLHVRKDPKDEKSPLVPNADGIAKAQLVIHESELTDEDKCFAHFWCGYFWGFAGYGGESWP